MHALPHNPPRLVSPRHTSDMSLPHPQSSLEFEVLNKMAHSYLSVSISYFDFLYISYSLPPQASGFIVQRTALYDPLFIYSNDKLMTLATPSLIISLRLFLFHLTLHHHPHT